jgi:hypothetical protein
MNCPKCWNPNIPDNATSCPACGAIFDQTAQQFGRLCPSGKHTMDPTWTSCAFCKAESPNASVDGHRPTVADPTRGNAVGFAPQGTVGEIPMPGAGTPGGARKTVAMSDFSDLRGVPPTVAPGMPAQPVAGGARKTVFGVQVPAPEIPAPVATAAATQPRIVAVLVSHSKLVNESGAIFAIREGRNKIGSDPGCEIAVPQDGTMSGWNTSITFRDGKYWISAKDSMNGTYLNGVEVPPDSTQQLPNYATIRAGSTAFRFIMVDPAETPAS